MSKPKTVDLSLGDPSSVLWRFCLPLFASVFFQQLYNLADSFVVGKFVGEDALAAVGNSYEATLVFIAISFGCSLGCSVVASNLFGAKDTKGIRTCVSTSFFASAAICAVLMAVGFSLAPSLLRAIRTPENIFSDSLCYLTIYLAGFPFLLFYNVSTGVFSALGDSKTPLIFLMCSSIANICMDILFVASFHMGVAGVAWATFLCQGVSCLLAVAVMIRRLHVVAPVKNGERQLFSAKMLKRMTSVAIPAMLQQTFISVGNVVLQGIINGFGSSVVAGYSAAVKLNNMVITSFTTIGNGISTFTAQNIGAGKMERVKSGFRSGVKLMWTICLPVVFLYVFGCGWLLRLFLDETSVVAMETGKNFLWIVSPFFFVVSAKLVCDGILKGSGMMKPFLLATFTDLFVRVALAYLLCKPFGVIGLWFPWPAGWMLSCAMTYFAYHSGPWFQQKAADGHRAY